MIGGAPIGSGNIGSFHIDNFVFGARGAGLALGSIEGGVNYSFDLSGAGFGLGGSDLAWQVLSLTVPAGIGLSGAQIQSEINGSISVDASVAGLGLGAPELSSDIVLRGVPEFTIIRSATSVTITVTNREGREIRLFRSDDYNRSFEEVVTFTSDTHVDSGLDATKNYKYKLAFTISVTPPIKGQRSISKFTKS